MLNAKYAVIASKEGIWVTAAGDDYTADVLACSWAELNDEDPFHAVFQLGSFPPDADRVKGVSFTVARIHGASVTITA